MIGFLFISINKVSSNFASLKQKSKRMTKEDRLVMMVLANSGCRSWKNVGPKFAVLTKHRRQELLWKLSTIQMELLASNLKLRIQTNTNKRKCSGKCFVKQTKKGIPPPVRQILLSVATRKQQKSLAYVIIILTQCFKPNRFNFKEGERILDICYNLETHGVARNGSDHGVITVPLGIHMSMLTSNSVRDHGTTVLILLMRLKRILMMVDSGLPSRISSDFSTK